MDGKKVYQLIGYAKTDVGFKRVNNEDNYWLDGFLHEEKLLRSERAYQTDAIGTFHCYGVFDGIGGEEHGELASFFGAESMRDSHEQLSQCREYQEVDAVMREAFLEANNRIVSKRAELPVCGTTGSALVTDGICFKVYHVGDSRIYLLREGKLYLLTNDQTMAQMKVDLGLYQRKSEATVKELHQLTEFIGRDDSMKYFAPTEGEWLDFRENDVFLLVTDGMYDTCSNRAMTAVFAQTSDLKKASDLFVSHALKKGGEDNITCVIIKKTEKEESENE